MSRLSGLRKLNKSTNKALAEHIELFPSFSEVLSDTSEKHPGQIFLIEGDKQYTYEYFDKLVNQCCYYFQDLALDPKDIISIVLRNSIDYLVLYFASIRYRTILNPFPFHLNGIEISEKIKSVKPKIVFCHKNHYKDLLSTGVDIKNLDDLVNESIVEVLSAYPEEAFSSSKVNEDQTAVLYYSSGTTGSPKSIEYTHKSMVLTQASMLRSNFTAQGSTHLCVLPLGHTASLRYTIKQCICTASTIILYESFWKLRAKLWDEVEKYHATFIEIVPTILIAILNTPYPKFEKNQVSSIEFIGCGSAYLSKNIQEAFEEKFSVKVANLYGLSETGATHFDDPRLPERKTGNIGKPFDIVDAKCFDENGNVIDSGEVGELGIKGSGILKNYYNDTELYERCFRGDYFMTGDLVKVDENGIYYYIDRIKDLIIKGGVNIVPSQIDETLLLHPAIEDVATIGKPDMLLGETIKSYIVLKQDHVVGISSLKSFCKEKIGDFKTPSEIEIIEVLPKGPSGKILKRELRDRELKLHV